MPAPRQIEIAIDHSEASRHAVEHVARVFGEAGSRIRLFHVVGPMPPWILEDTAFDITDRQQRDLALDEEEARWFAEASEGVEPMFRDATGLLLKAGIAPDQITTHVAEAVPEDNLAALILEDARNAQCDLIVVGHNAYSWLTEMFHKHVGDELTRSASDIEVQIVL